MVLFLIRRLINGYRKNTNTLDIYDMSRQLTIIIFLFFLVGCQPPIVKKRTFAFEAEVIVDGQKLELRKVYQCHYQDLTWISTRGKSWNNREGYRSVKVTGVLDDGVKFEALPIVMSSNFIDDIECTKKPKLLGTRIFLDLGGFNLESFDSESTKGEKHSIEIVKSSIRQIGYGFSLFKQETDWPRGKRPVESYYTIYARYYDRANWILENEIDDYIDSGYMTLFEKGKTFPAELKSKFTFARRLERAGQQYSSRVFLKPENNEWHVSAESGGAIKWKIDPKHSIKDKADTNALSKGLEQWIVFEGSRIEAPLGRDSRIFYLPDSNRILKIDIGRKAHP